MERVRLRRHFARVIGELKADRAREADEPRRETIRRLETYARRGLFPRHGGRGAPRPVFVDAVETRCAVAYLLESAGEESSVAAIRATANHARVPQLARDPRMADSVRRLGLSVDEAARVQPQYSVSSWVCLSLFAMQWAGAAGAIYLVTLAVRLVRGRWRGPLQTRVALAGLACLAIAAGWSGYAAIHPPPREPMSFGPMYTMGNCGSAFHPGNVARCGWSAVTGQTHPVTPDWRERFPHSAPDRAPAPAAR
ncbi:hypothetical protein [Longimicrobium terrae]|nr:hypothetical protein [Longimicrobium terrae]MBB4639008.1 hypothetical protein [Longimicrobium terrae]